MVCRLLLSVKVVLKVDHLLPGFMLSNHCILVQVGSLQLGSKVIFVRKLVRCPKVLGTVTGLMPLFHGVHELDGLKLFPC